MDYIRTTLSIRRIYKERADRQLVLAMHKRMDDDKYNIRNYLTKHTKRIYSYSCYITLSSLKRYLKEVLEEIVAITETPKENGGKRRDKPAVRRLITITKRTINRWEKGE